jgi:hypothetical protein
MIKFNKHLLFIFLAFTLTACDSSDDDIPDLDGDGVEDSIDTDRDGDGVENTLDAFPDDKTESKDTDGDGIGDNTDTDIDGDGVDNELDVFPLDPNESVDTDGDGIGDNADDSLNLASKMNNGSLRSAESWVYSLDSKFAYLGTYQGILINTLDENGSFTDKSKLITASDLGINFEISSTRYLKISTKGFLYWIGNVLSEDGVEDTQNDGFIAKLTLEPNSGEISENQFIRFTSVLDTTSPGTPEMFVLSPNEDKLYTSVHYGDLDNVMITFDLDSTTGDLSYLNQLALGSSNFPSYEHNMAMSSDGNFLYYGLSNYGGDIAPLLIISLNEETKVPETFTTQDIKLSTDELNTSGLIIKSILSDKLIIATVEHLGIYSYSSITGMLTVESKVDFETPTSTPVSIAISDDQGHVALIRNENRDNQNNSQLNVFTLDGSNNLELIDSEVGIGVSADLRFNKNLISAIGIRNDNVFEYSLLENTLTEVNPFNSFYTEGANVVSAKDNILSFVNLDDEFVSISTTNTPSVTYREKLNVLQTSRTDALITLPNKILQFSYQYDSEANNYRTEYLVGNVQDDGKLISTITTLYTDGSLLFNAYSVGTYIVTLERTPEYNYFIGLYELNSDKLEVIDKSLTIDRDTYLTYIYGAMRPTNDGILLGDDEYIVVDEQLVLNTNYVDTNANEISLISGSLKVSFEDKLLTVSKANDEVITVTELNSFDSAYKLDDERVLLLSNVTNGKFNFVIYHFNADGTFEMQSQGDYQVFAPNDSTVSVELSDTGNTAWLLINGGYSDIGYLNLDL